MMKDWTPREQLAAMAMMGILAGEGKAALIEDDVASLAFIVADAMLAHPKPQKKLPEDREVVDGTSR